MTFELSGIVTEKFSVETYSNFKKRRFWLQQPDTEKFPQQWQIEIHTNQLALLDPIKAGDRVTCTVNLLGRQIKNKAGEKVVINTLQCWKLKKEEEDNKKFPPKKEPVTVADEDDTELPF